MWSQVCLVPTFCIDAAVPGCHSWPLLLSRGVEDLLVIGRPCSTSASSSRAHVHSGESKGQLHNSAWRLQLWWVGEPWIRNQENHFSSRLYSNEADGSSGLHFSVCQWACWMRTRSFPRFFWVQVGSCGCRRPFPAARALGWVWPHRRGLRLGQRLWEAALPAFGEGRLWLGTSLLARWWRPCLPVQETRDPWVWKIPWRRKWQPLQYSWLGNGQRSLVGYSPWDHERVGHDLVTQ